MAVVVVEVAYPAWWDAATTVQVSKVSGGTFAAVAPADVEFLPHGVSIAAVAFVPWSNVGDIQKLT